MPSYCSIVPPHLLEGIATSHHNPAPIRQAAQTSLDHHHEYIARRRKHLDTHRQYLERQSASQGRQFVPRDLLQHIVDSKAVDLEHQEAAERDIIASASLLANDGGQTIKAKDAAKDNSYSMTAFSVIKPSLGRQAAEAPQVDSSALTRENVPPRIEKSELQEPGNAPADQGAISSLHATVSSTQQTVDRPSTGTEHLYDRPACPVYDAHNTTTRIQLPGSLIHVSPTQRTGDYPGSPDKAAVEAYTNIEKVIESYRSLFIWNSLDNHASTVTGCVHVGKQLQNAFWDGTQLLFGDGGKYISNFTACLDVIGHKLTHAVTQHTCCFAYEGQSGALNEHLSDVFGIVIKHHADNVKAKEAKWLIGEGCLLPTVAGVAL